MSAKLDKLGAERDAARRKRDLWDARFQELEKKYLEQENTEIHEMVHAHNLTPDQLAAVLAALQTTLPGPAVTADLPTGTETPVEMEDETYED